MRSILYVLCAAFALYSAFVYSHSDPATKPAAFTTQVEAGQRVWQEKNCQSCHQLYGLGGYMGPDLTNAAAKGEDYLRTFIQYGTGRMPNLHLRKGEVADVIAFLQWVDSSGRTRVPDSAVHWTGTYFFPTPNP